MNNSTAVVLLASAVVYGTPLLLAGLGELLAERSGVLNLGVEGMMLMGALTAFWGVQHIGGPGWWVLIAATLAAGFIGALTASVHAFLAVTMKANQIVSGLAVSIFAGTTGLSAYLGNLGRVGASPPKQHFHATDLFGLARLPILGPIIFHHDPLVYTSWILVVMASLYLYRSQFGRRLRAVGEAPETADALGINVTLYRYVHVVIGGALAGIAGAYYSIVIVLSWVAGMTGGEGFIAIALVIFAYWRPGLLVVGAYFFGALSSLAPILEARGITLPTELFDSVPYIATVIAMALMATGWAQKRVGAPAALGRAYTREAG